MLKERLNLSLNEEAAKALTDLADRLKMSRTAIIEAVLVEAARRENVAENDQRLRRGLHLKTDTSSAEFKEWESDQARAGRKAITVSVVKEAGDNERAFAAATSCPKHRPKYCEPDCMHRVAV